MSRHHAKTGTALMVAVVFALSATACAPEPEDVAGHTDKESSDATSPETEWGGLDVTDDELVTVLPESFPSDAFAVPDTATIHNAGERNQDEWFLVLEAADEAAADALWEQIISENGFEVSDLSETVEGGQAATLNSAVLTVQALTIPQQDGSVQLSYDLLRWG